MSHSWIPINACDDLPPFAITAGHDIDGDPIYVGRAYHRGDILPAKVIPDKGQAYVSYDGKEINKNSIEILTGHHYHWIADSDGSIPPNALRIGQTTDGEPLYVGRGHWKGSLTPGKVHVSHGCLYIPFDGKEESIKNYEVLTRH